MMRLVNNAPVSTAPWQVSDDDLCDMHVHHPQHTSPALAILTAGFIALTLVFTLFSDLINPLRSVSMYPSLG